MTVLITLTTVVDAGPFELRSDADSYASPFQSGLTKAQLQAGYSATNVPDLATVVRVQSTGNCKNFIDISLTGATTTTTTTIPTSMLGAKFIVLTFGWVASGGTNLDINVSLLQPILTQPCIPVGTWNCGSLASGKKAGPYLYWSGDNRNNTGPESVYLDIDKILLDAPGTTVVRLRLEAYWETWALGTFTLKAEGWMGPISVSPPYTFIGTSLVGRVGFGSPNTHAVNYASRTCIGEFTFNITTGVVGLFPCLA